MQLVDPKIEIRSHHELLSAIRLLISEKKCEGKFVFNNQVPARIPAPLALGSRTASGPGGDNSKSQLQTLLTRAGNNAPTYKTTQLTNGQFRATVDLNGTEITGRPCNNKKQAEKDAAAEALEWLKGGSHESRDYIECMSMMLKKSKKDHHS